MGLGYRPGSSNPPDSAFTGTSEEGFARSKLWYRPNPKPALHAFLHSFVAEQPGSVCRLLDGPFANPTAAAEETRMATAAAERVARIRDRLFEPDLAARIPAAVAG